MAAESRTTVQPLIEELENHPRDFSFFRAVWLLERAYPTSASVGGLGPAADETLRLRPTSSMAFQGSDVRRIEKAPGKTDGTTRYRLTTPIMGLYGASSPLPSFYSEDILRYEMLEEEDPARLLLDLVNHRLLSLLYRTWSHYRWSFTYRQGGRDRISQFLMGWLGLGPEALQQRAGVPASELLRYAGLIAQRPRNAAAAAGVISDYFGDIPVRLVQCVERWVKVHPDDQARLGVANFQLGENLTVGETVIDRTGKCRIEIGPLELDDFRLLRRGGKQHGALCGLARLMLPDVLQFDLQLILKQNQVPATRLGGAEPTELGVTTWLLSEPSASDKAAIFDPAIDPLAA